MNYCAYTYCNNCILLPYPCHIRKLRSSEAGQLLIQLCFGFLGIYVMFIVAFYTTSVTALCVISGALVQYFLLATFLVMAGESINLYMKLVVVLGAKIESYVLKVAIVAWSKLQEFHVYIWQGFSFIV